MTEPITPIDPSVELRGKIVDVVRSALRPDARPPEAAPAPGTTAAQSTSIAGQAAGDERAAAAERRTEAEVEASRNLALRFRIDPDTHTVTVLLIDQVTKKIVRSVPPEDLQKLNNGELVHLLA